MNAPTLRSTARWSTVAVLLVHGAVQGTAAAAAFGLQTGTGLPISGTGIGVLWAAAGLSALAAAGMVAVSAPRWWQAVPVAALTSQLAIATAWPQAAPGTVVVALLLLVAGYGYAAHGRRSFRVEYNRRSHAALQVAAADEDLVTGAHLQALPAPVARYLRRCGVIGRPKVHSLRAVIHGRIRRGPQDPWMSFTGEQVNTYSAQPRRFFYLDATMRGLPVDVLHCFDDCSATMRARLASLVRIVDASGPEMTHAETATLFNDLCILAPAALLDAPVTWTTIDDHRLRGTFTACSRSVSAELFFDDAGDLIDFVTDDRLRANATGKAFTAQRWSTPLHTYGNLGPRRLTTGGRGVWHAPDPEGTFTYLEYNLDALAYNPHDLDGHRTGASATPA